MRDIIGCGIVPFERFDMESFDVKAYGAVGNTRNVRDAVLASGSSTVTSATANFTSADIGKIIYGIEISSGSIKLARGTIVSINSSSSIVVSTTGSSNYTGVSLIWGTDDTAAIQAAGVAARATVPPGCVFFPSGGYLFNKLLFDTGNPGGGAAATCKAIGILGSGSGKTFLFIDATYDFTTTTANQGMFNKQLTGGNIESLWIRGLTIDAGNFRFTDRLSGQSVIQAEVSQGLYEDVVIQHVRDEIHGFAVRAGSTFYKCVALDVGSNGYDVSFPCTFFHSSASNTQVNGLFLSGPSDSYGGDSVQVFGGVWDECGQQAADITGAVDVVFVGATLLGPSDRYAVRIRDNSVVKFIGSRIIPYTTSGNRGGLSVTNASTVYLTNCRVDKAGTQYAIDNAGTIYDCGGNTILGTINGNLPIGQFGSPGLNGQASTVRQATTTLSAMSGATVTATNLIPANSIVLGVTLRVTTLITGATSFDIGDGSDVDRWGAAVAVAANTTSATATITSLPFYAATTSVVLTANGSNFTAGAVRVTVHYMSTTAPTS